MWIAGKEVSLESRHTRLYEKYKTARTGMRKAGCEEATL